MLVKFKNTLFSELARLHRMNIREQRKRLLTTEYTEEKEKSTGFKRLRLHTLDGWHYRYSLNNPMLFSAQRSLLFLCGEITFAFVVLY